MTHIINDRCLYDRIKQIGEPYVLCWRTAKGWQPGDTVILSGQPFSVVRRISDAEAQAIFEQKRREQPTLERYSGIVERYLMVTD